jgi:hypothetical protein
MLGCHTSHKFKCGQYKYFPGNWLLKVRVTLHVAWSYIRVNAEYAKTQNLKQEPLHQVIPEYKASADQPRGLVVSVSDY